MYSAAMFNGYSDIAEQVAEARNVKAQELPSNFESLSWNEKTIKLIEHFEWFSAKSFWDYKQYTRWYGTKAPWPNQTISQPEAEKKLIDEYEKKMLVLDEEKREMV